MRVFELLALAILLGASCSGQDQTTRSAVQQSQPQSTIPFRAGAADSILTSERQNLKSDLAELRALLNVLSSQESGMDMRTVAAMQTNRKMWQVVIARLAEITQRLDEMERQNSLKSVGPGDPH